MNWADFKIAVAKGLVASAESVANIVSGATKVGNADKLDGLKAEEFVSNENLLINADFKNPVNTSGKTSWSGNTFIDKWTSYKQDTDNFSISLADNGIVLTKGNGGFADIYASLYCSLEIGRKYTLSALINGTVYVITFLYNGGNYSNIKNNIFLVANSSQFGLRFNVAQSYTIEWIKLEVGSVATAFIPQNLALENVKCGVANADTVDGIHASGFLKRTSGRIDNMSFDAQNGLYILIDGTIYKIPYGYGPADILHKSNSRPVVVSSTAPTDTTAVWIVP